MNKHKEEILDICFQCLLDHKEKDTEPIYRHYESDSRCLTIQVNGTRVTDIEAKNLLQEWIEEDLKTSNMIFLYICRDNAEIDLQRPTNVDLESAINRCEIQYLEEDNPYKLYIGFD